MSQKPIAILFLSVFLAAMLAVPAVSAQPQPTLDTPEVTGFTGGPITPLITQNFKVESTYTFNQPASQLGGLEGSVTVNIDVRCPSGVTVTGQTSRVITIDPAKNDPTYDITASFQLTMSRNVVALETQQSSDDLSATGVGTSIPAPSAQSSAFSVQADYFGLIEAKTDIKLKQGGPQKQIPFNIEVTNFGNGQTKVSFLTEEKPSGKWQGLPPDQLLLDEAGGNRESASVVYTVVTPFKNGWNNEEGGFTLRMTPEFSIDSEKKGSDVLINLVARVRGVYVPSLEPMIMLGAVIGTAFVARLMRE